MISGLSHMTFIVRDLAAFRSILTQVLDAREIYASGDATFSTSREMFFDLAGMWIAAMGCRRQLQSRRLTRSRRPISNSTSNGFARRD